jgi:hypothetical protein
VVDHDPQMREVDGCLECMGYFYLCAECGSVTSHEYWIGWGYDDEGRPVLASHDDEPAFHRCPVCRHDHRDHYPTSPGEVVDLVIDGIATMLLRSAAPASAEPDEQGSRPTEADITAGAERLADGSWSYEDEQGQRHGVTRDEIAHAVLFGFFSDVPPPSAEPDAAPASAVPAGGDELAGDIKLALGATGAITSKTPCWKCGETQPAHGCRPADHARERLLALADRREPAPWAARLSSTTNERDDGA